MSKTIHVGWNCVHITTSLSTGVFTLHIYQRISFVILSFCFMYKWKAFYLNDIEIFIFCFCYRGTFLYSILQLNFEILRNCDHENCYSVRGRMEIGGQMENLKLRHIILTPFLTPDMVLSSEYQLFDKICIFQYFISLLDLFLFPTFFHFNAGIAVGCSCR